MPTLLPRDDDSTPIPAVMLRPDGAHAVSFDAGSSSANATAFAPATRVVSLYATEPVYVRLGEAGVTANSGDHFFPAGIYYDIAISNVKTVHYPHIAALGVGGAGTLFISEKE